MNIGSLIEDNIKRFGEYESVYFEGRWYTNAETNHNANRLGNALKALGISKGDRVIVQMPNSPPVFSAFPAIYKIGGIVVPLNPLLRPDQASYIYRDCGAKAILTSSDYLGWIKDAQSRAPSLKHLILTDRDDVPDTVSYRELLSSNSDKLAIEETDNDDVAALLYTAGTTGKPKGVLHTTGGYLLFTNLTFRWIFDYHDEDIHFCTADIGWVTGHSYIVYGPMSNGATSLMFEGIPTYPDAGRFWNIVDKHKVNIFYTAPTAIRALMREGESWVEKHDLSSLRVLGTVGEPINPEAWMWYHVHVGKEKLPIVDTWWQTETGGILITPLPGAMTSKPGSVNRPFPGVVPKVLKEDGSAAGVNEGGYLVIEKPWPGMLRGTYGDPENKRIKEVYFTRFPGKYLTGDGARVDEDGDYWLMGRIDDVINVSGHRLGTAEVESALVSHEAVAEAAVVGFPHEIKGEGIYAYVTLKEGQQPSEELKKILVGHVRTAIGPIASPDKLQFAPGLPKTRSGKIMRRILRKIAHGQIEDLGDTSTLADPSVVDSLVKGKL